MRTLRVKLLAFRGAGEKFYQQGKTQFLRLLDPSHVEFVDTEPDLLFFLSGGSERLAAEVLKPGKYYALLASQASNAYAAATEVKAYADQQGIGSVLLDYEDRELPGFLSHLYHALSGLQRLRGQTVGLIGQVSDWLIASNIDPSLLQAKLGILLRQFPWSSLPAYQTQPAAEELLETFQGADPDIRDTAKVYTLLHNCILAEQLAGITVECFSLVTEHAVTACLPLAKLNADGIPSGCEGDIVSIIGMMLAKELTGIVPWMANAARVSPRGALFAHCTIAPNLLNNYAITTHFETGKGTAVQGEFAADDITLFRLNSSLTKAFLTPGIVMKRPRCDDACRTQIEVRLPPSAINALREHPLGNHHLILPGDHGERFSLACALLGIDLQ